MSQRLNLRRVKMRQWRKRLRIKWYVGEAWRVPAPGRVLGPFHDTRPIG